MHTYKLNHMYSLVAYEVSYNNAGVKKYFIRYSVQTCIIKRKVNILNVTYGPTDGQTDILVPRNSCI